MEWEKLQNTLQKTNWLVLLVLSSFGYFIMSPFWTAGVLFGGLIAVANFSLLQHTVRRAFLLKGSTRARGFPSWGNTTSGLLAWG